MIDLTSLIASMIDLVIIMLGISFICSNWEPPMQKSLQGLIVLVVGCILGAVLKSDVTVGLLAGTIAFWRADIIVAIKSLKKDANELKEGKGKEE